jgi:hypothetical protein
MDDMAAHRKARGENHQQEGLPQRDALSIQELPPRLEEVQDDEYFEVEDIRDWR